MKKLFSLDGDYVECDVRVIHSTDRAYLVEYGDTKAWLPKSQVIDIDFKGDIATIVIPEWLAKDKELI